MNTKNIVEQNELLELTDKELEGVCGGRGIWWFPPYRYTYNYQNSSANGYSYGNSGNNTNSGVGGISIGNGNGGTSYNSNDQ